MHLTQLIAASGLLYSAALALPLQSWPANQLLLLSPHRQSQSPEIPPLQPEDIPVHLFTRTPQAPAARYHRPPTPYPRHPQLDPSSPSSTSHRTPSSQHSSNTYQQVSAPSRILRSSSLSTRQATPRPARAAAAAAAQYPTSLGSPQPSIAGSHRVIVGSPITSGRQQSTITYQPLVAPPQQQLQLQPPSRRPSATSYHDPPSSDVRSNLHSGPSSSHYSPTGSSGPLYWYQTPESQGKPSPELERGFVPPHPDDARRAAEYERWAAKVREENRRSGWRPGR